MSSFISGSIFFAITSIFSLTCCYEPPSELPGWFDSLTSTSLATVLNASPRAFSDFGSHVKDQSLTEKISKMSWDIFGYMATMLGALTRRTTLVRPNVELGPGSFKPEILKYPENYFVNRLKMLLKIKKRDEDMNKPLNQPE